MPFKEREAFVTVLYEDGRPIECFVRSGKNSVEEGSVYIGLVEKVDEQLGAAFVRIGDNGRTGYLPLSKSKNIIFCGAKKDGVIKPMDRIIVMVEKAAVKTKHCVLTGDLSISGKYLVVFAHNDKKIGFSAKLSKEQKKKLRESAGEMIREEYGVMFRTLCGNADTESIRREYERLCGIMERIVKYGVSRPHGTCLYRNGAPEEDMIKRTVDTELDEIVTDIRELYDGLLEKCSLYDMPADRLRFYDDSMIDLYKLYNFSTLISRITDPVVNLKSGASLKIETTEAFVVIDVNSANSSKKYRNAASFLPVNLEAADEIASQIRLRQLSGIILIDFINMKSREDEKVLEDHFKELIRKDHVHTAFIDITRLGIMEVTRQKKYMNISEQLNLLKTSS